MTTDRTFRTSIIRWAGVLAVAAFAGCGGSGPTGEPAPAVPAANPKPDDQFKEITLENESANMDKLKKAGAK